MRVDVICLAFTGFVLVYDLTVYSASILPYIQSVTESEDQASLVLSVDISASAFSQVTCSLISGYLARVLTMKWVFFIFQTSGIFGTLIYAFSGWPIGSAWGIVIGRTFSGVNAASFGLILSYISTIATDRAERAALIANYRAVTILAAIPSSIMALVLALPILEFSIGSYSFNAYTYPAWSSLILQTLSLALNVYFLKKVEKGKAEPPKSPTSEKPKNIYISPGVILILAIFLYDGYFISVFAYTLPIVMIDGYGWSIIQYAPVNFGISIVGLTCVILTKKIGSRLGEYFYVIIVPCLGYMSIMAVFMLVGSLGVGKLPTGIGETLFLFGAETSFGGFQVIQTSLSSIFSQVIPPEFMIRMMPLTSGMFGLGKVIGPLLCEVQVAVAGIGFVFYTLLVVSGLLMFVVILLNKHLRNIDEEDHIIVVTEDEENESESQSILAINKK